MIDWVQVLSIIFTVIGTSYYVHREVQADIKSANARTDRLYEMFIDLLKDRKKKDE